MNDADFKILHEVIEAQAERWRLEWATVAALRLKALEDRDWQLADDCKAQLEKLVEERLCGMIARYPEGK